MLLLTFATAEASAQTLSRIWTVPGVSDNGNVKTYVTCTNNTSGAVTVGVEIFGGNGVSVNGGTVTATALTFQPNETRQFATTAGGAFVADSILATGNFNIGSAAILASAKSKVNCSAWLANLAAMVSLTVAPKDKQKGD